MTSATEQSVERLDVDNYATWRSRMKFLLIVSKACPECCDVALLATRTVCQPACASGFSSMSRLVCTLTRSRFA